MPTDRPPEKSQDATSVRDERVSVMARLSPGVVHHRIRVFAGPDADHRASCGELTLRETEATELLRILAAGGADVETQRMAVPDA